MGNFEDHMRWAAGSYVLGLLILGLIVTTVSLPLTVLGLAALSLPLTLAGGAFPDIDHHASKPYKAFRLFTTIAGVGGGAYAIFAFGEPLSTTVAASAGLPQAAVWGGFIIAGGISIGLISRFTLAIVQPRHRGPTHRVPIGLLVTAGIGGAIGFLATSISLLTPLLIGGVAAGFFFMGFMSHLACDGMLTSLDTYITLS